MPVQRQILQARFAVMYGICAWSIYCIKSLIAKLSFIFKMSICFLAFFFNWNIKTEIPIQMSWKIWMIPADHEKQLNLHGYQVQLPGAISIDYSRTGVKSKQPLTGYKWNVTVENLPVCIRRRLEKMESKAKIKSHVLMFGLSVNLLLTLCSLGFTCYSLNRLDSRLTAVEQNQLLQNPPHQPANQVITKPTHAQLRRSGSQTRDTIRFKRASDSQSICQKCSNICSYPHDARKVRFKLLIACIPPRRFPSYAFLKVLHRKSIGRIIDEDMYMCH